MPECRTVSVIEKWKIRGKFVKWLLCADPKSANIKDKNKEQIKCSSYMLKEAPALYLRKSAQISLQIFCPGIKCHQLWILLISKVLNGAGAGVQQRNSVFLCGTLQNIWISKIVKADHTLQCMITFFMHCFLFWMWGVNREVCNNKKCPFTTKASAKIHFGENVEGELRVNGHFLGEIITLGWPLYTVHNIKSTKKSPKLDNPVQNLFARAC